MVRTLIGYNARLVESRWKGKTPLMVAAHQGHLEIADLLLSSGAAVDAADDEGDQSVHYAVIGRQPPSVLQVQICQKRGRIGCVIPHEWKIETSSQTHARGIG